MKLATLLYNNQWHLGVVDTDWADSASARVLLLTTHPAWPNDIKTMQQLIERASDTLPLIRNDILSNQSISKQTFSKQTFSKKAPQQPAGQPVNVSWIPLNEVRLCAPIPLPIRNVMCLGWNYAEHAKESSSVKGLQIDNLPSHPIVFTKATTTVNGPFDDILYDENVSRRLDWEVELGVIIGKKGRHIPEHEALDHVFGYTVINDVSARDLQKQHQQFFLGKSMDGTCPMGPWIATAEEVNDPQNLRLRCLVNNQVKQEASTRQQIFTVANVIATLSSVMTLLPGDVIATGTPSGVGFARTPPEYLAPGDVVECEVEHIGRIKNTVKAAREQSPK